MAATARRMLSQRGLRFGHIVACIGMTAGMVPTAIASPDAVRQRMHPPLVAAHRGGYFESGNPLAKVRASLRAGKADIVEVDLRLTRDGVVVVSHDASAFKSGDCLGDIATFTYAALSACADAANAAAVPRWESLLDVVHGRAIVNAEFKTVAVVAPAIRLVEAAHAKPWVYFQATGDLTKYRLAREFDRDVALLLKVTSDAEIGRAIALHDPHLIVLELDRDFVTPQRVTRIHAAGMLASVNSFRYQFTAERFGASCDRVFAMGVDISVSNNPTGCAEQSNVWRSDGFASDGESLDRQHLRGYFGGSKLALELCLAGIVLLICAVAARVGRPLWRSALGSATWRKPTPGVNPPF